MRKIFLGIFMLSVLFFTMGCGGMSENQETNQREDTIFNGKAEALIGNLKLFAANGNFDLSEPKISNSDNQKFCVVNFGGQEGNTINLKLNADDSVINEKIVVSEVKNFEYGKMAGMLLSGTLLSIGIEEAELQKFLTSYQQAVEAEIRKQNNSATPIINIDVKVYCPPVKKDLNVKIQSDDKQMSYFIEITH